MRRSRALAGGLALACVAGSGCGVSSEEIIKPRPPSGQGETRGPDVSVEQVDDLRSVEVVVNRGVFQPRQVSIGLDSTVRIVNGDDRTTTIRTVRKLAPRIDNPRLSPGETAEIDFLDPGVEYIALKGSKAQLEINVFPPG